MARDVLQRSSSYFEHRFCDKKGSEYGKAVHEILRRVKSQFDASPPRRSCWLDLLAEILQGSDSPIGAANAAAGHAPVTNY